MPSRTDGWCGRHVGQDGAGIQPATSLPEGVELRIGNHSDQDHRTHHGKIQRRRNAEQVDEILQHLQQHDPEHHADDRPSPPRSENPPRTAAAMA